MVFKKLFVSAALVGLFTASLGLSQGAEPAPAPTTPPATESAPMSPGMEHKSMEPGMEHKHHGEDMGMCCTMKKKKMCKKADWMKMTKHECHEKKGHFMKEKM